MTAKKPGKQVLKKETDAFDAGQLLTALKALKKGDFTVRLPDDQIGIAGAVADGFNEVVETNQSLARELDRIRSTVGKEGKIKQRAAIIGAMGSWATCVDSVNLLIEDLVQPVKEMSFIIETVAQGDLSQRMSLEIDGIPLKGEFQRTAKTLNTMVDQLSSFASEVTRVAREVGIEGKLGSQARVSGAAGIWKDLTDNVNELAANLTTQFRAIAEVATAVTEGDLTRSITADARGEVADLKDRVNEMISNLREATRINSEQDWLKTNLARFTGMVAG